MFALVLACVASESQALCFLTSLSVYKFNLFIASSTSRADRYPLFDQTKHAKSGVKFGASLRLIKSLGFFFAF